ncbi:MAG: methyltransferase domain-containing protein [Gammaproteobacteria bacterium]|nr:methyltransferase domain-containing protein [Gammaproteobacteria bacterium]
MNTDIDDLHLQAPALIESAIRRLRPNGILMIALPLRSHWEILLITVRAWWERWTGGHFQFWSRRRLSALLESRGFMNLESIKIRTSSRRRQIMILVAKKTG